MKTYQKPELTVIILKEDIITNSHEQIIENPDEE